MDDKLTQHIKELMEKDSGKEVSWDEASVAAQRLVDYADLLLEVYFKDQKRKERLKESPKGFLLEGGYTCLVCGDAGERHGGMWYDRWGQKCMTCQRAVEQGHIPGWVAEHKESWYSKYDLESRFKMTTPILKKWIKDGIIKPRNVLLENGRVHVQIFLIYDNKDFLPPKRLTESRSVSEVKDGTRWFRSEPWFRFVDPFEHLKGYRIMDHMREVPAQKKEPC